MANLYGDMEMVYKPQMERDRKDAERWKCCLANPNLAGLIMFEATNPDTKAENIAAYITDAIDAEIARTTELKSPQ